MHWSGRQSIGNWDKLVFHSTKQMKFTSSCLICGWKCYNVCFNANLTGKSKINIKTRILICFDKITFVSNVILQQKHNFAMIPKHVVSVVSCYVMKLFFAFMHIYNIWLINNWSWEFYSFSVSDVWKGNKAYKAWYELGLCGSPWMMSWMLSGFMIIIGMRVIWGGLLCHWRYF